MLIIEHLDGAQNYELHLLERWKLLDLEALLGWLRGQESPIPEPPVQITGDVPELMFPAGPRGGRLPR